MPREKLYLRIACVCLAIVGAGTLIFGLVEVVAPSGSNHSLSRADGLASIGLGLFGVMITVVPFGRRERWAWFTLWFYPVFWVVHLAARLPPGKDHIHQVVFIVLSLAGLLLPVSQFFPRGRTANTSV
jgi:hypothetical protein